MYQRLPVRQWPAVRLPLVSNIVISKKIQLSWCGMLSCPGRGDAVEIALAEPHAVAQCQPWPEEVEAVDVVECGAAAAAGILLLVSGLDEVHVHRRLVARRIIGKQGECGVRAPVEIGRRQLDLDPAPCRGCWRGDARTRRHNPRGLAESAQNLTRRYSVGRSSKAPSPIRI